MDAIQTFAGVGHSARMQDLSGDIAKLRVQAAGGDGYLDNLAMQKGGDFKRYINLDRLAGEAEQAQASVHPLKQTADEMISELKQVQDMAQELHEFTLGKVKTAAERQTKAAEMFAKLTPLLNKQGVNGEYLFAGAASGEAPVGDLTVSNLDGAGNPTVDYYHGAADARTYTVAGNTVVITVNASHQGVRDLVGAIHKLNIPGTDIMEVQDLAKSAKRGLIQAHTTMNKEFNGRLQTISDQLGKEAARLSDEMSGITKLDSAGVMRIQQELNDRQMQMMLIAKVLHMPALWELTS